MPEEASEAPEGNEPEVSEDRDPTIEEGEDVDDADIISSAQSQS